MRGSLITAGGNGGKELRQSSVGRVYITAHYRTPAATPGRFSSVFRAFRPCFIVTYRDRRLAKSFQRWRK